MIKTASLGPHEEKKASLSARDLTSAKGANLSAFDADRLKTVISEEAEDKTKGIKTQKQVLDRHHRERCLFRAVIKYSSNVSTSFPQYKTEVRRALRERDKKRGKIKAPCLECHAHVPPPANETGRSPREEDASHRIAISTPNVNQSQNRALCAESSCPLPGLDWEEQSALKKKSTLHHFCRRGVCMVRSVKSSAFVLRAFLFIRRPSERP